MSLNVFVFEDEAHTQFYPLAHLRPIFALRSGILPLYKRVQRFFPGAQVSLICREEVAPLMAQQEPDFPINILKRNSGDVLMVNGRLRDPGDLSQLADSAQLSTVFRSDKEIAAILLKDFSLGEIPSLATPSDYLSLLNDQKTELLSHETTAQLYSYCWDLVADIDQEIKADFEFLNPTVLGPGAADVYPGVIVIEPQKVHVGEGCNLKPGAVLDASAGPIYIADNCRVDSQAAIYGPCFIDHDSVVVAGKVEGCSIGHTCRVGGEVEESVFQSCVNKYHAGFIGHSYVGSWVNFGAMTTNSDLKNNYSNIWVSLGGKRVNSGSIKVGSFIGDHTKFGIGTLLNTGINIGVCCNIFGGTLIVDREIPSFSWGGMDGFKNYFIDKAIETAQKSTVRRDLPLSDCEETLLRDLAKGQTSGDGMMDLTGLPGRLDSEPGQ